MYLRGIRGAFTSLRIPASDVMIQHAPSDATDEKLYECESCLSRTAASSRPTACPDCDGSLRNIAVPRE